MDAPAKILLVEDDEAVRIATGRVLQAGGYELLLAQNGNEALERIRVDRPDLVLLDVNLPDLSGDEVCRQIKRDPALEAIFVVQISAISVDSDSQSRGLEAGADGYIVRPIANRELLARIQAYVRIQNTEKRLKETTRRLEHELAERQRAEASNRLYGQQLAIVADIQHSLVPFLSPEAIYDLLVAGVQKLFPDVSTVFVSSFDPEREMIRAVCGVHDGERVDVASLPEIPLAPEGQGTQSKVIRSRQPLVVATDLKSKFRPGNTTRVGSNDRDTCSALYVPMIAQDEVLGLVQCQSYLPNRFTKDDIQALSLIANTAAVSIQNAHLLRMAQTDIIERKLAEEKLTHLSLRHQLILLSAAEGILGLDLEGRQTFVNPAAAHMLGYESMELLGVPGHATWHHTRSDGTTYPPDECPIAGAFRRGVVCRVDTEVFWRKDGTSFPVEYTSTPIYEHGRLAGAVVTFVDVTERRQAEQEMRRRVKELEMLYESGLALSQLLTPAEIGQKVIELLEQRLHWHHIAIRLYEPQKGILELLTFSQPDLKDATQLRQAQERFRSLVVPGQGLSVWAVQQRCSILSGRVDLDPRYKETYPGMQSGLYILMQAGSKVVGVISIESAQPDAFTEADQRLATTLANQAAVAIENARLTAGLEQRVRERTAEVQDLYDRAPTGYHSLDENGVIVMINQTELDWLGYRREELVGVRTFRDLLVPQSQQVFDQNFPIFKAQGVIHDLEFELVCKDGRTFPVLLNATAIYDPAGKYLHSRSTMLDITARRRAEEEARKLSHAVEHSNVSVIFANRDARIEYVNPMFSEVTGYTKEEVLGKNPRILQSGVHPREYYQSMWATLLAGRAWQGEFCNRRKNGELFWEYASISPIRNEYGETTHYVAIKEDITERKKAEEALRESRDQLSAANVALEKAARLKDEFLASMSHELHTPLTGILGLSEALQLKTYGDLSPKQANAVANIYESGRHLLELINDILDLSKIEAGKLELQFAPCMLADVCQASLQLIKGMAQQKKQMVSYTPLAQPVLIRADARRLKQILVNLLSNAVKFTSEGGELGLEVRASEPERVIKLTVWDTGIGIRPEDLPSLFKPFTQLDGGLSREHSGTGLGLSLVKRLIELHNGGIEVDSAPGKGSRFTIALPWSPHDTTPVPGYLGAVRGTRPLVPLARAVAPKILLADDNEMVLQMIADFLETQRYDVLKARNGPELLDLAARYHPKAILLDIQMPGMNGLEAIRRIRAHADPLVAAAYVVVITAMAMSGDRERCLRAGANEYLSKPVRLKELAAIIQKQLEAK